MAVILKIGYQEFLVRKGAAAATVIKALADALPMDSKFRGDRLVYFPSQRRRDAEISMKTVLAADILATDPGDGDLPEDEGTGVRQHGNGPARKCLKEPQRLQGY